MIIGAGRSHDLAAFRDGLAQAARGVLRVEAPGQSQSLCSAWLVTDSLVVVPGFAVAGWDDRLGRPFTCFLDREQAVAAELVHRPDDGGTAMLRLREPQPGSALRLELDAAAADHRVLLIHHPLGMPRAHLSIGRVLDVDGHRIHHDAATEPGSAGAPLLSVDNLAVLGMHVSSSLDRGPYNEALSLVEMLDGLRESPAWTEIARHHKLADLASPIRVVTGVETPPDLLPAAVRWSVDPADLSPAAREEAAEVVVDPAATRWSLPGEERRQLIAAAASMAALRTARGAPDPADRDEPGQRAIDRILAGPPFDLDTVDEVELPYWLPAVRWFAPVVPGLPTAGEVDGVLARRRVRGRLRTVASERFLGRRAELDRLRHWYADTAAGPMVVTGIGGVGKSALVAQFAIHLPERSVLLWLDFDRPDLAPDDAVSVLARLGEQAAAQLDGFTTRQADPQRWEAAADVLGSALARALPPADPALLVLDGFEIAQHVERHAEIWDVLERLLARAPTVRVIVSGRAPVPDLTLADRHAAHLTLRGLEPEHATAWLRENGVTDPEVVSAVLRVADGIPLVLKLAVRLIEEGGRVDVPAELPRRLVDGYLYQRILHRVVDRRLRPLARDALVLRRVTADMLTAVLADALPPGTDAAEVFALLAREMALMEGAEAGPAETLGLLRLRPELRAATLRLLETDDADRVREIDRRAVRWYRGQNPDDVAVAAELVYHLLRLGDVDAAERAWRDGCAPLLRDAGGDLPDGATRERAWLRDRLSRAAGSTAEIAEWEHDAAGRIRAALRRGLLRGVPRILDERAQRTPTGPLVVFDAWRQWQDGRPVVALATLTAAGDDGGPDGRDRAVLAACLAAAGLADDQARAHEWLGGVTRPQRWADRPDGQLCALAVQAARVRLAVDLAAELELAQMLQHEDPGGELLAVVRGLLAPGDAVLPSLTAALTGPTPESLDLVPTVPARLGELPAFARDVERSRRALGTEKRAGADGEHLTMAVGLGLARDLAGLAERRRRIATSTLFLAEASELADRVVPDNLTLAVVATLAAFRGQPLRLPTGEPSLDHLLDGIRVSWPSSPGPPDDRLTPWSSHSLRYEQRVRGLGDSLPTSWAELNRSGQDLGFNAFVGYLLGPHPLDALHRRVLGLPEGPR